MENYYLLKNNTGVKIYHNKIKNMGENRGKG